MDALKRGFEILGQEKIISDLEWLLEETRYRLSESDLRSAVEDYSRDNKQGTVTHKFTISDIKFEIEKSAMRASYAPMDDGSTTYGDVLIRVENETVVKLGCSATRNEWGSSPTEISSFLSDRNVIKLKKTWVEALKLFFKASRSVLKAKELELEKEREQESVKRLLDNVDLGDYE